MTLRVTFLGTGSAMPTADRVQTGILLEGDGRRLLVDCGSGVLHRLAGTESGYEGVASVLLTHHHLDHVADLLPLLKARWLAEEAHLEVVGPVGTKALLAALLDTHDYLRDRVDLRVREVGAQDFEVAGFQVDARETRHSMTCLAYRFDDAFAFSGDTRAFGGLARFVDGVSVLAHDCSFPDGIASETHPTPTALGETLAGTDLSRVYLTHLYPHTRGHEAEMCETVADHVDADVRPARDGTTVEIGVDGSIATAEDA